MNRLNSDNQHILEQLTQILESRLPAKGGDIKASYVAQLMHKGPDAFLKKIGEEATELVMACKDETPERIVSETADLWFHCMIALTYYGLNANQVLAELSKRQGISGLEEKSNRS